MSFQVPIIFHVYYIQSFFCFFIALGQFLSLSLGLVGVRLVLGLELEVGVRRSQEHLTFRNVSICSDFQNAGDLRDFDPILVVATGHESLQFIATTESGGSVVNARREMLQ